MILNVGCGGRENDKMIWYGDIRIDIIPFPNVTHVCDVHQLPAEWENTFEKVICYTVLEHLENPYKALKEMSRVLEPKGTIEIVVPNVFHWRRIARNYEHKINKWNPDSNLPNHKQAWDLTEMRNLVKQAHDLNIVDVEYLDWLPEQKIKAKNLLSKFIDRFLPPIFTKSEVKFILKKGG